ncbi:MAG: LiaI-LiaF-like domain-containing protein [Candidatus Korobacteraceae bacterium]
MKYRYNPHCSCGRCRAHGFMGPAVLITLGVLFLLDQVGRIYWLHFDNTWPALLIVIGLVMFLQHNASASGHVPRQYGAGPPAWQSQDQRYGAPQYPPPPQVSPSPAAFARDGVEAPVVTPPPAPQAGPITPGASWNKPDDPGVRNG